MLWFTRLIVFLERSLYVIRFSGDFRSVDGGDIARYEDLIPTLNRREIFRTPQIIDRLKPVCYLLGLIDAFGGKVSCVQP